MKRDLTVAKILRATYSLTADMEKYFKRNIKQLREVFAFVAAFVEENRLDDSLMFTINLIVEELFTNMIKYNPTGKTEILIDLQSLPDRVVISLADRASEPFDITQSREYDTHQNLEDRPIGGVGLHLIKQMVDKIDYQYQDGISKITLIKFLGNSYA